MCGGGFGFGAFEGGGVFEEVIGVGEEGGGGCEGALILGLGWDEWGAFWGGEAAGVEVALGGDGEGDPVVFVAAEPLFAFAWEGVEAVWEGGGVMEEAADEIDAGGGGVIGHGGYWTRGSSRGCGHCIGLSPIRCGTRGDDERPAR